MDRQSFKVCVRCITYNHSEYIVDSMNGFCIQETDFPFICEIIDDFSTDGEQNIIKTYVNKHFCVIEKQETNDYCSVFARHLDNKNCYFVVFFLKYNHYQIKKLKSSYCHPWENRSSYIAICEGDDYWNNEHKLQLQVDFLDKNKDYSMCFGDVLFHYVNGSKPDVHCNKYHRKANEKLNVSKEKAFYSIIKGTSRIQTLSAVIRLDYFYNRLPDNHSFMMGDTQLWLDLSQKGRIGYIQDCLGVYNIHEGSATNDRSKRKRFTLSAKEMCVYYCEKYGYKVPFQKKVEYNLAYYDLLLSNKGDIIPQPLYSPFAYNKLHEFIMSRCLKMVFPIEKNLYLLFIRIRSAFLQISNIF